MGPFYSWGHRDDSLMQEPHIHNPLSVFYPPQHSVGFSAVTRDGYKRAGHRNRRTLPRDAEGWGQVGKGVERRGWEAAEQLERWSQGSGKT